MNANEVLANIGKEIIGGTSISGYTLERKTGDNFSFFPLSR
jgi:aspartate ammonia-lyase